jgi:hypothetical protein
VRAHVYVCVCVCVCVQCHFRDASTSLPSVPPPSTQPPPPPLSSTLPSQQRIPESWHDRQMPVKVTHTHAWAYCTRAYTYASPTRVMARPHTHAHTHAHTHTHACTHTHTHTHAHAHAHTHTFLRACSGRPGADSEAGPGAAGSCVPTAGAGTGAGDPHGNITHDSQAHPIIPGLSRDYAWVPFSALGCLDEPWPPSHDPRRPNTSCSHKSHTYTTSTGVCPHPADTDIQTNTHTHVHTHTHAHMHTPIA